MVSLEETLRSARDHYPDSVRWIGNLSHRDMNRLSSGYLIQPLGRHIDGSILYSLKYRIPDLPDSKIMAK